MRQCHLEITKTYPSEARTKASPALSPEPISESGPNPHVSATTSSLISETSQSESETAKPFAVVEMTPPKSELPTHSSITASSAAE